jgi:NAD(P)-dependent dehydrogenase (short-subunit alcohol dehydrogenase family)
VTGANRGIGLEICRQLGRRGLRVILTSRNAELGRTACRQLADEGLDVHYAELDVADGASIARFAAQLQEIHGGADVLINNAAVLLDEADTRVLDCPLEQVGVTLETNLYGSWRLCQALIPPMVARGYGRVVNVSSGAGQLSALGDDMPAYRLSKASLNALTRMLAAGLSESNVLVNSVDPGPVRTRLGGNTARRSVERGAETAVWLATLPDQAHQPRASRLRHLTRRVGALLTGWRVHRGGFFRDRKPIPW